MDIDDVWLLAYAAKLGARSGDPLGDLARPLLRAAPLFQGRVECLVSVGGGLGGRRRLFGCLLRDARALLREELEIEPLGAAGRLRTGVPGV